VIAETAQFADHLARSHLLRFFADGWSAFLIANALVKNLRNQTTQPVGDGANGLRMPEARDESSIHDREDRPLGLDGGIRRLIEDAPHLPVALRAAVTVVDAGALLGAGASARGYFCATVGAVDEKTVIAYIDSQEWDHDDEAFKVVASLEPAPSRSRVRRLPATSRLSVGRESTAFSR
jgi:hypothetical protein